MEAFASSSYENILYESICIVDDLVLKVLGVVNRKIHLPISLDIIINYFIHSSIKREDLDITIMLILVKLSLILDMLK